MNAAIRRARRLMPALALLTALAGPVAALAQDRAADEARRKYEAARPSESELAMYKLDWAATLEEAQTRAAKERRPVFLVVIHAKYGNLFTGHC